jgi:protein-disulfide isomerase-like protein with CxxC motif
MTATRKFTAPNVVGKESYLDGRRIKNDDTYRKVAEAARLESKMFNEPPEKRGDMQKELRKLRGYADSKEKPSRDGGNGK